MRRYHVSGSRDAHGEPSARVTARGRRGVAADHQRVTARTRAASRRSASRFAPISPSLPAARRARDLLYFALAARCPTPIRGAKFRLRPRSKAHSSSRFWRGLVRRANRHAGARPGEGAHHRVTLTGRVVCTARARDQPAEQRGSGCWPWTLTGQRSSHSPRCRAVAGHASGEDLQNLD